MADSSKPPSPKPMPTTATAGRENLKSLSELVGKPVGQQNIGQMSVNPGKSGNK